MRSRYCSAFLSAFWYSTDTPFVSVVFIDVVVVVVVDGSVVVVFFFVVVVVVVVVVFVVGLVVVVFIVVVAFVVEGLSAFFFVEEAFVIVVGLLVGSLDCTSSSVTVTDDSGIVASVLIGSVISETVVGGGNRSSCSSVDGFSGERIGLPQAVTRIVIIISVIASSFFI